MEPVQPTALVMCGPLAQMRATPPGRAFPIRRLQSPARFSPLHAESSLVLSWLLSLGVLAVVSLRRRLRRRLRHRLQDACCGLALERAIRTAGAHSVSDRKASLAERPAETSG